MVTVDEFKTAIRMPGSTPAMDLHIANLLAWANLKIHAVADTNNPLAFPAMEQAAIALATYVFDRPGGGQGTRFANAFVNSGARAMLAEYLRPQTAVIGDAPAAREDPPAPTDTVPPALQTVVIEGAELQLVYDEALDPDFVPSAARFVVRVNGGGGRSISAVLVSGATVGITLARAVDGDANVTLDYRPDADGLRDAAGNLAAGFTGKGVVNRTSPEMVTIRLGWTPGSRADAPEAGDLHEGFSFLAPVANDRAVGRYQGWPAAPAGTDPDPVVADLHAAIWISTGFSLVSFNGNGSSAFLPPVPVTTADGAGRVYVTGLAQAYQFYPQDPHTFIVTRETA